MARLVSRPPILVLVGSTLALNASFFMLLPLFPVHATTTLGLSAAAAGGVLAARQFLQNALMVLAGAVADRFSQRTTMVVGLVARAIGFLGLGFATDLPILLLAAVVVALGGSCFDAASRATLAQLTPLDGRIKVFAVLSIAFSLGSGLGPALGAIVYPLGFAFVCQLGALWLLVCAALIVPLVPEKTQGVHASQTIASNLSTAFKDRAFVRFSAMSTGLWVLGTLLYVALPLHVVAMTGSAEVVGLLFSLYALILLVLQYPLASVTAPRLSPRARLSAGLAVSGLGFLLLAIATGLPGLTIAVALIACGRMLTEPTFNDLVTRMAPPESLATYVGLGYLGLGIGGALGNLGGGFFFDLALQAEALWLPWVLYGLLGLVLSLIYARITLRVET